ncbi:WGxxGxxG family protein [Gloeocapsopsis dulcis]|uniref:Lipoprotein n=1 Tax=Gloeocapsopsis dulcis AAB1 = 1H9 TaxID=1433147 RepID=A0A6N8G2U4_9CHRO|nr:WGxxGxxG family protein [Gloeocapsopsis dulcis]MUL39274.1 hypothetical protein [Gloeocapsopsis dulcis AAB1 = 1H9]WNN89437.1 WGxxGxxG-CTERM domain-containing protein [Gloeocapsopsis dulcis]
MKRLKFSKIVSAGALMLSTAVLFLTLSACAPAPVTTVPAAPVVPPTRVVYADDGFDWGWLGLIGLFGLFGLTGKKRRTETNAYRDPDIVSRTDYRE